MRLNDRIDDAYRTRYGSSTYLAPMISDRARGNCPYHAT